jgi:hypothetical protein
MSTIADKIPVTVGIERLVRAKGDFTVRMIPAHSFRSFEIFPYIAIAILLLVGGAIVFLEQKIGHVPIKPAAWAVFVLWSIFVFRYYFSGGQRRWASEVEGGVEARSVVFLRGWTFLFLAIPLAVVFSAIWLR